MQIPLRQDYAPDLARIRGWLLAFSLFAFLSILAFLRSAMATVISGVGGGGLIALVMALVLLIAWIGLLMHKRWSYYLYLATGLFWLIMTGLELITAPDQWLFGDWAFDAPVLGEFVLTAGWLAYFLYSRRVYSVYFGPSRH